MERKYLVCFFHWTNNISSGFGDIIVTEGENENIYTPEELQIVKNRIIDLNGYSGCSIQNITPLN